MGGWASGVTTAKGSDRGEYLPEGTYDAEVVFTDAFDKREGIAQGRRVADYVFENAFQKER